MASLNDNYMILNELLIDWLEKHDRSFDALSKAMSTLKALESTVETAAGFEETLPLQQARLWFLLLNKLKEDLSHDDANVLDTQWRHLHHTLCYKPESVEQDIEGFMATLDELATRPSISLS